MQSFFEQTKKVANQARQAGISNLNAASKSLSQASGTSIKLTTAKTDVELKRLLEHEPILLEGSVWKRRGGLGKLTAASAWESRHLQLRGRVLLYFDSDPSKALSSSNDPQELLRGYLDLEEERATVVASFGHSGAPSPFCLSIKHPVGITDETKWKICFDHHQTQMEWLAAMSDVIIQSSVDAYNRSILEKAALPPGQSPTNASGGLLGTPRVYEPGEKETQNTNKTTIRNGFQIVDSPHQLWMMDDYTVRKKTNKSKEEQEKTEASVNTALQVMERLLADERNHRATADQKVTALELEVETLRTEKDEGQTKVEQMTKEKKLLEEELAIRMSTYDLGENGNNEGASTDEASKALQSQVENLNKELQDQKNAVQQLEDEKEALQLEMDQRVSELDTKMVILKEEHQQALEKMQAEASKNDAESAAADTIALEAEIKSLKAQLEAEKEEYQTSLQALAADFTSKLALAESSKSKAPSTPTDNEREIRQVFSESSNDEEFMDAVEILKSPGRKD